MSPATMKGFGLAISFLVLVAGLPLLRGFRFERVPGTATTTLADLRAMPLELPLGAKWSEVHGQPVLGLEVSGPGTLRPYRIALPDRKAVTALHVSIDATASDLLMGKRLWDAGRVLVEWRAPDDSVSREVDPVCSLQGNEVVDGLSIVMMPNIRPSLPILRIENLGKAGNLSINLLELTPVRERLAWRCGRWLLLGAWCVWLYLLLSGMTFAAAWKKGLATMIWVGFCLVFVFPGPWKTLHSLGIGYQLGKVVAVAAATELVSPGKSSSDATASPPAGSSKSTSPVVAPPFSATGSLDQIQVADGWILKIKRMFVNERPLLHALLLLVPTLCFVWLVGIRAAWIMGTSIALSIELAQVAFGFGFDANDIGDLMSDAAGISLAFWIHHLLRKWIGKRQQSRHG